MGWGVRDESGGRDTFHITCSSPSTHCCPWGFRDSEDSAWGKGTEVGALSKSGLCLGEVWEGESACSPGAATGPPEKPGAARSLPRLQSTRQGACGCWDGSDPASRHLPGCGSKPGWSCGDLPLLSLCAATPTPCPPGVGGHRVPWGSVGGGVGCCRSGKAGSPPHPHPSRLLRGGPGPRPPPGRRPPHLATRRSPSRGRGAGPLRLGCVGPPGVHVSAGPGLTRGAGAAGGRAVGQGLGLPPLGSPRLPPGRPRRRRLPRRTRSCQSRGARRAGGRGGPGGALAPSRGARAARTWGRSPGWGAGSVDGGRGEEEDAGGPRGGAGEGWRGRGEEGGRAGAKGGGSGGEGRDPLALPSRHLVTRAEGRGRGRRGGGAEIPAFGAQSTQP